MEIVSSNYNVVKKDLLTALDIIDKSNDIDRVVAAYIGIIDFYEDMQIRQELYEVLKKLREISKTSQWTLAQETLHNYLNMFDEKMMINSDAYFNFFKEQLQTIEEILGRIKFNNNFASLRNDDDIYNILCTYLKEFDPKLLSLFNEYIEKKTILQVDLPFYLGITSASPIFDNIYVKVRRKYTLEDMLTILHEISHALVFQEFIKTQGYEKFNKIVSTNLYLEVYPRLQERYFLQFLLDNNILVEEVKKYLVKWVLVFKEMLLKSIKSYDKDKKFDYADIKDINSFLYRDLLFLSNFAVGDSKNIGDTIEEEFYLNNFNLNDIRSSMKTSCEEIKMLVK